MRSFILLSCLLAVGHGRMLPLVGLQSSQEQGDDGRQIEEFQDVGESSEVEEKVLDTVEETSAVEEEELNKNSIKPWSRYDPGKRLSYRRRQGRLQKAKNFRRMETELLEGLSEEALPQFYKLLLNEKISRSERNEMLAKWAEQNKCGEKLRVFLEREGEMRQEKRQQVEGFVRSVGEKAGEVLDILEKEDASKEEKRQQIREVAKGSSHGVDRVPSLIFPRAFRARRYIRPAGHSRHRGHNRHHRSTEFEN